MSYFKPIGHKAKDLIDTPHMLAEALRRDGWYYRADLIWHKPNPMPESVTDRPTKAHEYMFLLTKSSSYFYDAEAIKEPCINNAGGPFSTAVANAQPQHGGESRYRTDKQAATGKRTYAGFNERWDAKEVLNPTSSRNKRSVWTVSPQPFADAHFATFPPKLIEPCILAGCPVGGIVLDMFMGSGTTALVARQYGRNYIGCDINAEYVAMANRRLAQPFTVNMFERVETG